MPQYSEDEVNKPSWVSNLRLIEIGPVDEDVEVPDAAEVPVDELWIYGSIPTVYPFSVIFPVIALLAGVLILAAAILSRMADRKKKRGASQVTAVLIIAARWWPRRPWRCRRACSAGPIPGDRSSPWAS